jgi:hypothetical protein
MSDSTNVLKTQSIDSLSIVFFDFIILLITNVDKMSIKMV